MKIKFNWLLFLMFSICSLSMYGQEQGELVSGNVYSDEEGPLFMVNVVERDNNNRVISAANTDMNGNFSMLIKNPKNKLYFTYIGYNERVLNIGSTRTFKVKMAESTEIEEVVVTARRRVTSGGLNIPENEVSFSQQSISADEFAGLSVTSIDDALQGQIAGLDIVANSGNVGSGSSMRLRGVTSINANTQPLIVVDDVIYESPYSDGFDYANATDEQFAQLLSLNPEDIESITVLKDAAATAAWGSKGSNGVLYIKKRRGRRGPTRVTYSYRFEGAYQPQGLNMLNGDDYTMLMKEAYFNPKQSNAASDIKEFNYDPTFSEYENFNNNTDWVKEVTQFGQKHIHHISLSGGGERATFRASGGYDYQTGTVIGQKLNRFSTSLALDYYVSDRIKIVTDFSLTYTDQQKNYSDILAAAYKKMPNQSVYTQDAYGNNTDAYYMMLQDASDELNGQRDLGNPVAIAMLAKNYEKHYRILPYFKLDYDFLGLHLDQHRLKYTGEVSFDIQNKNVNKFYPKELTTAAWNDGAVNKAELDDNKSVSINTKHYLNFTPYLGKDHSLMTNLMFEMTTGTSRSQYARSFGYPTGSITNPTADAYLDDFNSGRGQWRSLGLLFQSHYSYKSKYNFGFTLRRDGSSKYGMNKKWGNFPGISFRWNISEEDFMEPSRKWLSMLSIRPSWGIVGNQPGDEYLHFSRYTSGGSYMDMPGIKPDNIRLTDLRWEKTTSYNIGTDIGFFNDMLNITFDYYDKKTEDLLMKDRGIPSSTGYTSLKWMNVGTMKNRGWDLNINTGKIVKFGDFSMSFNMNFSNNVNTIVEMDPTVLASLNNDFSYKNGEYLTRIQLENAYGSIYGFKYKGVYQYNIDNEDLKASGYTLGTAPIARDANGNIIYDAKGNPKPMYFAYGHSSAYQFKGGDAMYEDINNDGSIDQYDIVYLGNSNPKFNGGFGTKLFYKNFRVNVFFNFRYGNDIVNEARMNAENMYTNNNQSTAVNWRWKQEGDPAHYLPRALYNSGYNYLGSDRFVEDGSFVRLKYIQLSYNLPLKTLAKTPFSALNLSFTANNLFCWTKYSGVDPEVGYGALGVSKDESQTPRAKSFTANITLGF